jgi:ubiquinone/menaquinone biosynthesis C-methylase UbiE
MPNSNAQFKKSASISHRNDEKKKRSSPFAPKLGKVLESKQHKKRTLHDYRRFIKSHYDGFPGALTSVTGVLTGHELFAGRVIGPLGFDVRGCKRILDAACGNGRYTQFILKKADADAKITGFDFSQGMLRRARKYLKSKRVSHVVADLTRLPYADGAFDAVVCGWVLEHLPDPAPGIYELARVLRPGGKMLLFTTEDTFNGAICSRLWHCRTYNRRDLKTLCEAASLRWSRDLWFTRLHSIFHLGGIVAELRRL